MKASTKRRQIREIWGLSGQPLPENHPLLDDGVLAGIGSGGPGFNNYRPNELEFLIGLVRDLKQKNEAERRHILTGIRPDIIIHVPFERGVTESREEGNFVAMELKRRATDKTATGAFTNLAKMKKALKYPLTIFINIDSNETHSALCPKSIAGQTVCFAVRLENRRSVVRTEASVRPAKKPFWSPAGLEGPDHYHPGTRPDECASRRRIGKTRIRAKAGRPIKFSVTSPYGGTEGSKYNVWVVVEQLM
jgi:hypothetical protein